MMNLAWLLLQQGEAERAHNMFSEVVTLATSRRNRVQEAMGLAGQGFIAHLEGDVSHALRLLKRALMLAHEAGERLFVGFFVDLLAVVAVGQAQVERAGRLFGASEALLEALHVPRNLLVTNALGPLHDSAIATMRSGPAADGFLAAWDIGRSQSLEEAVAYALSEQSLTVAGTDRSATASELNE
jgi:hypothetical protein